MKGIAATVTRGLPIGAYMRTCDNSGAKEVQIIGVKGVKTKKGRIASAGIADMVTVRVVKGKPDVRNKTSLAIVVRHKKEYRRSDGIHIKFEDNSVVLVKDDRANPKGTILKGPIAKEAAERWPAVAKLASIIV